MLRLDAVSKSYSHGGKIIAALDNVTLTIPEGDYISVIGPSGSGKSTLLLVLGGMLSPSQGHVFLREQSIYDLTPDQRARIRGKSIGFVFQTFNLVPYLTALENVQVPLMFATLNGHSRKSRAEQLLQRVGLDNRIDHKPSELSVGQQQRVALARMLANDPEIILADEPTGNLDPETSLQILDFLSEINMEGRTVVMVTHNPEAAKRAKRTLKLLDGKIFSEDKEKSGP
jgi:putative ABC transport system ATP-binding protein